MKSTHKGATLAQCKISKRYYEKHKDTQEYKERKRKYYLTHKEKWKR